MTLIPRRLSLLEKLAFIALGMAIATINAQRQEPCIEFQEVPMPPEGRRVPK